MLNDRAFFLFSDGSCNLHLVDKDSLKEVQRKCITDPANGNEPLKNVNALQFVKGKVLANVWMEDRIAVISEGRLAELGAHDAGSTSPS